MLFKVKEDARHSEYVALGGMVFTKKNVVNVPDALVDAARLLVFLEEVGRQLPPGMEESKQAPEKEFVQSVSGMRPEEIVRKEFDLKPGGAEPELKAAEGQEVKKSDAQRKAEARAEEEAKVNAEASKPAEAPVPAEEEKVKSKKSGK